MPATLLSHQALVLPLKLRWPRWFSGLALCIGSMAPDLEFIARMADDWIFSHTLSALLWFTVPVTMLLHWLMTALMLPALLPFLRKTVPHFGGPVPLHDALQFWFTIIFAVASVLLWRHFARHRLLWCWRAQRAQTLPRQPRWDGHRLLVAGVACAALGAGFGLQHRHPHPKAAAAAVAFGAIDATLVGMLLVSLRLRQRRPERRLGPDASAVVG
jgi:hypothetical protein